MLKKLCTLWIVISLLIGIAVGAILVTFKTVRSEVATLTYTVADATFNLVPILLALNEDDLEAQVQLIEYSARSRLTTGIKIMHLNLSILNREERENIEDVLRSLASKRAKLGIGKFADPPSDDIEEILLAYVE